MLNNGVLGCIQIADAHSLGATAVSWSPAAPAGSLVSAKGPGQPEKRLASSGADNTVKVCKPLSCSRGSNFCTKTALLKWLILAITQRLWHAGVALK